MVEERAKRARTDILTADEPQPVELSVTFDLIDETGFMSRPCRA
jgi:hypothetical protein